MAYLETSTKMEGKGAPLSAREYCAQIAAFLRANPEAWTQGAAARDQHGQSIDPLSAHARRWCAVGLLVRFIRQESTRLEARTLLVRTVSRPGHMPISAEQFNDGQRSVEPVIQMFEAAAHLPPLPPAPLRSSPFIPPSKAFIEAFTAAGGFVSDGVPIPPIEQGGAPDWLKLAAAELEKKITREPTFA